MKSCIFERQAAAACGKDRAMEENREEMQQPPKETKEEKTDAPKVTDFTITNSEVMTGGCVHPSFQSPLSRP